MKGLPLPVSEIIEINLEHLNANHPGITARGRERLAQKIDKINRDIAKCSIEINGQDYDGETPQFNNPFPNNKTLHQANGSFSESEGVPLIWRTLDNALHLEVIM